MLARIVLPLVAVAAFVPAAPMTQARYGMGQPATPHDIAGWDIDILPDGSGLPPGAGTVKEGERIFAETCAVCHGPNGEGKPMDRLVGGRGTLTTATPVKTVGSYWPYATTLFDYVRRAMPFSAPQSLSSDQIYAVSAYILYLNGIVPENAVMNAMSLPKAAMPNRNGFISPNPRPNGAQEPCQKKRR
jgi:mono/diheme cytochrome c family protein